MCRIYLQVLWLSDIVTADGQNILRQTMKGQRAGMYNTPYKWPLQPRPPLAAWTLWRKALRKCLGIDYTVTPLLPHRHSLRNWSCDLPTSHWFWHYDNERNKIIQVIPTVPDTRYCIFTNMGKQKIRKPLYHKTRVDRRTIENTTPCTVDYLPNDNDTVFLTGHGIVRKNKR